MAPVLVLVVSVAALHAEIRGSSLSLGWAITYAVVGPTVALGYVLFTGPRLLPRWALPGAVVLFLSTGALLERDQRSAVGLIVVCLVLLVLLPRAPRHRPAPPTPLSRTGTPHPHQTGQWAVPDLPHRGGAPLPQAGPPVQIPLLRTKGMLALLGAMALALLMGYGLIHVAIYQSSPDDSFAVRIGLGVAGVVVGVLALLGMLVAVRTRGDTLTIDGRGLTRAGGMLKWHLPWEEVQAIGIRDLTLVVPNVRTPTPRRLRERRDVRLMVALTGPAAARRIRFRVIRDGPEPFTHEQPLPDLSAFRKGEGLVPVLDRELAARVPQRYAGFLVQRPDQQRHRR